MREYNNSNNNVTLSEENSWVMFGPKLSGPPENTDYRRTTGLTSCATKMIEPTRLRPVIFMR